MPSLSAVIPVFNRAHSLARAIESALGQAMPSGWSMDVIVVDDGSSDALDAALAAFGDRVILLRHDGNRGAAAARNTGVAASDADYFAFLDSDDCWLPCKLVTQLGMMEAKGWQASCAAYRLRRPGRTDIVAPSIPSGELRLDDLVWGCYVSPGSTLIAKRSLAQEIGPLDPTLRRLEDWDWLLRYTQRHPLGFVSEPLALIEPSPAPSVESVAVALDIMRSRYAEALSNGQRAHFLAALDVVEAATHYRAGNLFSMSVALLRSVWRVPFGNLAVASILSNRRS